MSPPRLVLRTLECARAWVRAAVEAFCAALPIREALVCRLQSFSGSPDAPRLLGIQKKSLP
ncbi:MAG: hypothetical protein LUG84_03545 [Akkermansiaceae bacterium]|nr:hypothetical protein [Akkermansiaceae bacterium]